MTESNLVMLRRTKSANSSLKSSFHSFKLKIRGSTNRANSFSRDWHDPKLINVDKQILVSFWWLMTLLISEKRSVPMNSSLEFSVFVCWRITLRAPCLTYILGSFISVTSSWTSSGVNWLCYSVVWAFDYGSIEVSFYWQKVVIYLFYLPCFNFIKEFNLMFNLISMRITLNVKFPKFMSSNPHFIKAQSLNPIVNSWISHWKVKILLKQQIISLNNNLKPKKLKRKPVS